MRLWIAAFLISLFAFQALPVVALGKTCLKAKVSTGETAGEDGGDDDGAAPEPGKLKKEGPQFEDYYLEPGSPHRFIFFKARAPRSLFFPAEKAVEAAAGHAQLDTPPPDRH